MNPDADALIQQWRIHRRNLDDLAIRKAKYGLDAPIALLRQIEDEEAALAELGQRLQKLEQSPAPNAPAPARTKAQRGETVTILFLAADPTDAARLRLGKEFAEINERLRMARQRKRFKLALPQLALRPDTISGALLDSRPQIVHFAGHGTPDGCVCFENRSGEALRIQPDALAALFEQFSGQIRCVLLNACYSEIQARAIARHIDFVIGMKNEISDEAAIAFTVGFYQGLGAGRTIEEAYRLGIVQIRLSGIAEEWIPVIIKKAISPNSL